MQSNARLFAACGTARSAPQVLVLGTDARSFLGVVRSLGRQGCDVHVAWCDPDELALRSRYVHRLHGIPAPGGLDGPWLEALEELLVAEPFDLVIPTNDPAAVALNHARDRLSELAPIQQLNRRAFDVCYDKRATSKLALELGIPVPEERVCSPGEFFEEQQLLEQFGTPLVLKPRVSFSFGRRKWEHQVRKARTREEVGASLKALLNQGDVLVQRNVPGKGVGVEVLAWKGEVLLAFQHERLHEPLDGGGSSYRRSVALDPELLAAAEKYARALDYNGVGMFEFKRNAPGEYWLIEINARFWGSLPLALHAGADFPWALFSCATRAEFPNLPPYRVGVTCRNVSMDWTWFLRNLRANRDDPTLATVSLPTLFGELLRALRCAEHYDSFALDDPWPALAEARQLLSDVRKIAMTKVQALPYRLRPMRGWLTSRLRAKAGAAGSVLFVCKGNICRSAFAQHYARRVLPERVAVESSGTYPHANRSAPAEAISAAGELNVDLQTHRSTVLDRAMVQQADILLVFDQGNLLKVRRLFPGVENKTFRLGALASGGSPDLRDPYGGDLAGFRSVYGQIKGSIDILASLIGS